MVARVSLCLMVKNEQDNLASCLRSAADLVHEIIVIDTGSTDRTRDVAASSIGPHLGIVPRIGLSKTQRWRA